MTNTILITGANGEVGHDLVDKFSKDKSEIITLDINDLDPQLTSKISKFYKGSVTDAEFIKSIFKNHKIDTIFHLAAILSTSGEKNPENAHLVNVGGTFNLISLANSFAVQSNTTIKFIFPSTIAVYGLPNIEIKNSSKPIKENEFLNPITIYGINKLYCEQLGQYFATHYMLLSSSFRGIDFRSLRFPGLIGAKTVPSGGTSDYAPEMIHTAAQGKSYESFVRDDTTLPFMAMLDASKALMMLSNADPKKVSGKIYNVDSFNISAKQIAEIVMEVFPNTAISYNPDVNRQKIVDSWPAAVDDSQARTDWGWSPDYDLTKTFKEYLIPQIKSKYSK